MNAPGLRPEGRRGAALVLSFMVLLVLILILAQIKTSTDTMARVARNEETAITMDAAIESCLLQVCEDLRTDGEAGGGGGSGAGMDPSAAGGEAGTAPGADDSSPTDSKEDDWARPQRTEINEIQLRILIQDEDSKFNLLSVLTQDDEEADKAVDRLGRVIEWARKGTDAEIDSGTARNMAVAMADYMRRRSDQVVPRPQLLSDSEIDEDVGVPLTLREFNALDPEIFPPDLFRDFIDEHGRVVHSLGSFLTVWSSMTTLDEAQQQARQDSGQTANTEDNGDESPDDQGQADGGEGIDGGSTAGQQGQGDSPSPGQGQGGGQAPPPPGWAINLNTAPGAVLHALIQDREMPYRFWDDVVEYRNEKDDTVEENDDPPLDEYGEEIIVHKYFHSVDDLSEIDGWVDLEPILQGELKNLLKTQSQVFSVFVTARKPTGEERVDPFARKEDIEKTEADWQGLIRTVRAVVWRRQVNESEVEILPIVRWEVLDYEPHEVLDYPDTRRSR